MVEAWFIVSTAYCQKMSLTSISALTSPDPRDRAVGPHGMHRGILTTIRNSFAGDVLPRSLKVRRVEVIF